jgi:hypothetical protein
MADSTFWRDLASQFQELHDLHGTLGANWHYIVGSGVTGNWEFTGSASGSIRSQFEALARRAAFEIATSDSSDLLTTWLETLRQNRCGFQLGELFIEKKDDGSAGLNHQTGSIHDVCEASANFCRTLESRALQVEFEEKQQNDPQNWSLFRRQFEAFKSIKERRREPPERIPEEFARNTIAQIYDIKPEDVTRQQINFEVAGLLPFYHNIELIPAAPKQESSPIPDTKSGDQTESKPIPASSPEETIAAQLQRLRDECRWTIPELAEAAGIDPRTVDRHLAGKSNPYPRTISAYERAFGKHLKRQVVINKMP